MNDKRDHGMLRRAWLLGVSGLDAADTVELPGVEQDLRRMHAFLCSQRGGAWLADEIVTVPDADMSKIPTLLGEACDLAFVYYAGPGRLARDGSILLRSVSMSGMLTEVVEVDASTLAHPRATRQVLIVDCRAHEAGLKLIEPILSIAAEEGAEAEARRRYDAAALASSPGLVCVKACRSGGGGSESTGGGVFTNALLRAAAGGADGMSMRDVFRGAVGIIRQEGRRQSPVLVAVPDEAAHLPFAV